MQQLKRWFYNHTRVSTNSTKKPAVIDLSKSVRVPQPWSVYHDMHRERINKIADEEWETYLAKIQVGEKMKMKMHVVSAVARRMFEEASPEEKAAVQKRCLDPGVAHVSGPEDEERTRQQVAQGRAE